MDFATLTDSPQGGREGRRGRRGWGGGPSVTAALFRWPKFREREIAPGNDAAGRSVRLHFPFLSIEEREREREGERDRQAGRQADRDRHTERWGVGGGCFVLFCYVELIFGPYATLGLFVPCATCAIVFWTADIISYHWRMEPAHKELLRIKRIIDIIFQCFGVWS